MVEPHPAHKDLPALYSAEISVWRGRWGMIVVAPGPEVVVDRVDLGPADVVTFAELGTPGRYRIDTGPDPYPVPPVDAAAARLPELGYVVAEASKNDPLTLSGWTQVTSMEWTAPCQPCR